jgi:symplekin
VYGILDASVFAMSSDNDAHSAPIIAQARSNSSDPGTGIPVDPLHALQAALTAPPGSPAQRAQLATLRAALDATPGRILLLLQMLLPYCRVSAENSEMKRWVLDLFANALGRASLSVDQRVQRACSLVYTRKCEYNKLKLIFKVAQQVFEPLAELLHDPHTPSSTRKLAIQSFTALYPVLFRWLSVPTSLEHLFRINVDPIYSCANRHARPQWDALAQAKARIIELLWAPTTPAGVRLTAMKFAQRVILVQTKGANDPRVCIQRSKTRDLR